MKHYNLSKRSAANLLGVKPELVAVTFCALKRSRVDFAVICGVRTEGEQRENVRKGVSKTMKSKHLPQADGWSHAVDLMPVGYASFDDIPAEAWDAVEEAMNEVAAELGVDLFNGYQRWGWDRPHWELESK